MSENREIPSAPEKSESPVAGSALQHDVPIRENVEIPLPASIPLYNASQSLNNSTVAAQSAYMSLASASNAPGSVPYHYQLPQPKTNTMHMTVAMLIRQYLKEIEANRASRDPGMDILVAEFNAVNLNTNDPPASPADNESVNDNLMNMEVEEYGDNQH